MIELSINGESRPVPSLEHMDQLLYELDEIPAFELWMSVPDGPAICMLRNGAQAWLMYLRVPGDAGWHSSGDPGREGDASYTLSNGQLDVYPLAWCLDVESCYKALAYFFVNDGDRPHWISWRES